MTKLYRVIIPVSDIDTAQQFYSQIFDDAGSRVSPGRHYFDCEGTILACYDPGADGDAHEARPNPDHVYREKEVLICALQYACPDEGIGFRYENPIVLGQHGCEALSKFPLSVDEIQ